MPTNVAHGIVGVAAPARCGGQVGDGPQSGPCAQPEPGRQLVIRPPRRSRQRWSVCRALRFPAAGPPMLPVLKIGMLPTVSHKRVLCRKCFSMTSKIMLWMDDSLVGGDD